MISSPRLFQQVLASVASGYGHAGPTSLKHQTDLPPIRPGPQSRSGDSLLIEDRLDSTDPGQGPQKLNGLGQSVHSGVNTSTVRRSLTLILVAFGLLGLHFGQHHFHSSPLSGTTFATV